MKKTKVTAKAEVVAVEAEVVAVEAEVVAPEAEVVAEVETVIEAGITTDDKKHVLQFVQASRDVQTTSKRVFEGVLRMNRCTPKSSHKANGEKMLLEFERICEDNAILSRAKRIVTLATKYTEAHYLANYDRLYFYNIERIVTLGVWLKTNTSNRVFKLFRDGIAGLWSDYAQPTAAEYNNSVAKFISGFKKAQGLSENAEGEFDFDKSKKSVVAELEKMSILQLAEILEKAKSLQDALSKSTTQKEEAAAIM